MIIGGCCGFRVVFDLCNWFYTGLPPNSYFSFSLLVMVKKKKKVKKAVVGKPCAKNPGDINANPEIVTGLNNNIWLRESYP
jgi:hypothetical protein